MQMLVMKTEENVKIEKRENRSIIISIEESNVKCYYLSKNEKNIKMKRKKRKKMKNEEEKILISEIEEGNGEMENVK